MVPNFLTAVPTLIQELFIEISTMGGGACLRRQQTHTLVNMLSVDCAWCLNGALAFCVDDI